MRRFRPALLTVALVTLLALPAFAGGGGGGGGHTTVSVDALEVILALQLGVACLVRRR